jgi:molybdopterin converting factor small subunit
VVVQLEIRLFAGLKCNNPDLPFFGKNEFILSVPEGTTIGDLRRILAIDPVIRLLVMVNHHCELEDWVLGDNDRIGIFPPIGGG